MIRAIRACKTAAEERAVVRKECASIRAAVSDNDQDYRHRNLAKLMFIHMLGYPTHFGQMECLKLIAAPGFPEKRIGYLGLMLLLDERQEVLMLVTNSLKQDLNHTNQYIVGLALCALGNICSAEMARDLAPEVERLLQFRDPNVRKKAALCSIRIVKKVPDLAENFVNPVVSLLKEKHHGVLLTGIQLCTDLCKLSEEALEFFRKKCTEGLVKVLKDVVNSPYAPEYDVGGIADPFLHIRLLRLLRVLGHGDADASDSMNDILAQVATKTESNKNAGNAILYECVETIMSIEDNSGLRVLAINILGRFLSNRDNNIRYVALNMLMKAISVDDQAVQRHRVTILECVKVSLFLLAGVILRGCLVRRMEFGGLESIKELEFVELGCNLMEFDCAFGWQNGNGISQKNWNLHGWLISPGLVTKTSWDSDASIRKRALELVYLLVNESNVKPLTKELIRLSTIKILMILTYHAHANISSLGFSLSPDKIWYIDQMLKVLPQAGNYIKDEVWHALIVVITNASNLHGYTVRSLYKAIQTSGDQETLVRVAVWCIGEYGDMLVNNIGMLDVEEPITVTENDAVDVIEIAIKRQHWILLPDPFVIFRRIKDIITQSKGSLLLEMQQRSIEFDSILKSIKIYRIWISLLLLGTALNLPNGVAKTAAAPLVDLLDLGSEEPAVPSSSGETFFRIFLICFIFLGFRYNPGQKSGTDVLLDLLSIGSPPPQNGSSAPDILSINKDNRTSVSALDSLSSTIRAICTSFIHSRIRNAPLVDLLADLVLILQHLVRCC
ncbi:hypothetical protein OSB04_021843 [Centaurea solstitialis]|uniref:AP-1 complex subunit gamma n=1 Tax=Centaurea solstitialis TaxID=347529 RepID=A0AA38SUY2_9ASTR|nr:hypothetical protein OSB04_021843 [Centaurea solstitialis]